VAGFLATVTKINKKTRSRAMRFIHFADNRFSDFSTSAYAFLAVEKFNSEWHFLVTLFCD
jgi:hypothetical protein